MVDVESSNNLCAGAVLENGSGSAAFGERLLFALEEEPIEQQQDHGADDGHNPARWLSGLVPAEGLAKVSGNERPSDAEQNRDDKTTRIFPRHQ